MSQANAHRSDGCGRPYRNYSGFTNETQIKIDVDWNISRYGEGDVRDLMSLYHFEATTRTGHFRCGR